MKTLTALPHSISVPFIVVPPDSEIFESAAQEIEPTYFNQSENGIAQFQNGPDQAQLLNKMTKVNTV